jgi:hypothetical protein
MPNAGRMVVVVKRDRLSRPWIVLRGDWLYGINVSKCSFALPFGNAGDVNHV